MDFIANARRQMLAGQMEEARERLLVSFEGLSEEQMVQPGVCGEWTVRDILVHVAAWDRANIEAFRLMLKGERPALLDIDEQDFNDEHDPRANRAPIAEVMNELNASREEMISLLRDIDNAHLFAPAPGEEHADLSMASCVSVQVAHDNEHAEMIEDWRDNLDSQ